MELDYKRSVATFRPSRAAGDTRLTGHGSVFTIRYALRRMPNHSTAPVRIGSKAFVTGQYGTIYTDAVTQSGWLQERAIIGPIRSGDDASGTLMAWTLDGHRLPVVPDVDLCSRPFAAARGIDIDELNMVAIGYGLLHRYRTVWDWPRGAITFNPR